MRGNLSSTFGAEHVLPALLPALEVSLVCPSVGSCIWSIGSGLVAEVVVRLSIWSVGWYVSIAGSSKVGVAHSSVDV